MACQSVMVAIHARLFICGRLHLSRMWQVLSGMPHKGQRVGPGWQIVWHHDAFRYRGCLFGTCVAYQAKKGLENDFLPGLAKWQLWQGHLLLEGQEHLHFRFTRLSKSMVTSEVLIRATFPRSIAQALSLAIELIHGLWDSLCKRLFPEGLLKESLFVYKLGDGGMQGIVKEIWQGSSRSYPGWHLIRLQGQLSGTEACTQRKKRKEKTTQARSSCVH
eukprot:559746-Pelagomonas_calceolata.AAC.1